MLYAACADYKHIHTDTSDINVMLYSNLISHQEYILTAYLSVYIPITSQHAYLLFVR